MTSIDRLRTALSRVPLATSGALRRLVEDPARTAVLAQRVMPHAIRGTFRFQRLSQVRSTVPLDTGEADETVGESADLFWTAVADDRFDVAEALVGDDPVRRVALLRLAGHLHAAVAEAVTLSTAQPTRRDRRRASRTAALARRELRELAPMAALRATSPESRRVRRPLHVVTNSLPEIQAGYTIRTDHIVRAQRDAGLDPQVVTRPGFPVLQGHLDAGSEIDVHGVPHFRLLPTFAPSRDPQAALRQHIDLLAGLTRRLDPDVLHAASGFVNAQAALGVRDITGARVVYEVRGFLEDSWASRHGGVVAETTDRYRLARQREIDAMLAADAVVTLGEAMRDEIVSRGVARDRVFIVPNGVDDHFLAPLPDKVAIRARLGIPAADIVVGIVTTMYPHEGILTLVDAAARLRDDGVDVHLVIVGGGPESDAVRSRVAQLDLGGHATIPGQVPVADVRDWYDVLDVFALPRIDSRVTRLVTPLKPVEAMARALPVVASDLPALAEIVGDDERGLLVRPDDPAALAEALGALVDVGRREALGEAARQWVAGCRTWAHAVRGYSGAYSGGADGQ